MNGRQTFKWKVQLQRQDGQIVEREVDVLWSPDKENAMDVVMNATGAMAKRDLARENMGVAALTAIHIPAEPIAA